MSPPTPLPVPAGAIDLDEVLANYPVLRQSLLSKFDDCPLSTFFELRYSNGWTTHPQARGTIFHRFAAEAIRDMRSHDRESIPIGTALAILEEVLEQRDVEAAERVRVPFRELPELRMAVVKFAKDNSFAIRRVVDVEKRLTADLSYRDDQGEVRTRTLTGQLDLLVADPEDDAGAIVIDWKDTWALPPDHNATPDRDKPDGLSYHGYFQQKFYAWLVMKNYPSVDRVTLREFYPRRTEARRAAVLRTKLEAVEKDLADVVLELDRCLASGKPKRLRFPEVAPWNPQPGKHCYYCLAKSHCPIDSEVLAENFAVTSERGAHTAAAFLQRLEALRATMREALRPWCEENGAIPVRWSKGRRAFGLRSPKSGKGSPSLTFFTPEGADRPANRVDEDAQLEDALRRSTEAAREERAA